MKNHSMNIRVYYEDTDLGGVVYYANYLRFIERARSEWIREIGIDQIKMRDDEKIIFVVTKLKADYLVPASFDDVLTIASKIKVVSPVRAYFYQNIYRIAMIFQQVFADFKILVFKSYNQHCHIFCIYGINETQTVLKISLVNFLRS